MFVYKISNKVNDFVYIGLTTRKNPEIRWKEHLRSSKTVNRRLYRAMRKHGIENFKFEIIATLKELKHHDLLFKVEREYIKQNNSYWFGYNDTLGGSIPTNKTRPKRGRKKLKEIVEKG